MTVTSYAQNNEDIMLWRALKHIENGFYIDVGAAWPDEHSVTKLFYDKGWHGINIEPNPVHIERFPKERLGDINLPLAISNKIGETEMYFISNTGLSSLNKKIADSHSKLGLKTTKCTVKLTTLASICEEHCKDKEIHFLKIDIEGHEKQALFGNDWVKFRPWVVVIEATLPMSQVENYSEWEPILLKANYLFAYADGLNRFYISKEHEELLTAFKYPPNYFDGFDTVREKQAEAKAQQAEAKAQQAEVKAQQAEAKAQQPEAKAQQPEAKAQLAEAKAQQAEANAKEAEAKAQQAETRAQQAEANAKESEAKAQQAETRAQQAEANEEHLYTQIQFIYSSRSWTFTKPLRWVNFQLNLVKQHGLFSRTKALLKKIVKLFIRYIVTFVNSYSFLRNILTKLLKLLGVYNFFRKVHKHLGDSKPPPPPITENLQQLTPSARLIYTNLKAKIIEQGKELD